jgi:hypothetical protein
MPLPDTDLNGRPIPGSQHQRTSSKQKPMIRKLLPFAFDALIAFHRLHRPLMFLTTLSILPTVRSRFVVGWRGSLLPWSTVSRALWWAALLSWTSGYSLTLLTIVYWWRKPLPRNRDEAETQD